MIDINKATNTEVGSVTPASEDTSATITLQRNITSRPIIFVTVISEQLLNYNTSYDEVNNSFIINLESGQNFVDGDTVNYLIVYL